MKRRVSRDHINKHVWRVISARHLISTHDALTVLCDASFLRTLLMLPECKQMKGAGEAGGDDRGSSSSHHHRKKNAPTPPTGTSSSSFPSDASATTPSQLLQSLTQECMNASGSAGIHRRITWAYLPSTATALRRMCDEPPAPTATTKGRGKASGGGGAASHPKKRLQRNDVESLLSSLSRVGGGGGAEPSTSTPSSAGASSNANEVKSLQAFYQHHQQQGRHSKETNDKEDNSDGHSPSRTSTVLVGTQSHDVRRALSTSAVLLRLTHHPTAMWLEIRGEAYPYDQQQKQQQSGMMDQHQRIMAAGRGPQLSPADIAFMNFIGRPPAAQKPASTGSNNTGSTTTGSSSATAAPPPAAPVRKRRASHQANPLSTKKKQKREVIRL